MWYFVTCRIPFDDEDSGYVVQADSDNDAGVKAVEQLLDDAGRGDEDPDDVDVYILHIVRCGETEPTILQGP